MVYNYSMRLYVKLLLLVFFAVVSCGGSQPAKAPENTIPCTVVRVVDGDTFHCRLSSGENERVMLICVENPES